MAERDDNAPRSSEQMSQEFLHFMQEAQFGTAQYSAINDLLDLRDVSHRLLAARQSGESDNIKLEIEYALVNERIKLGASRIGGYSRAYRQFVELEEGLGMTLADEAQKRYQSDEERESYWQSIHDPIMDEAREIILSKRE